MAQGGHELPLGVGVAVGFATCGEIGFPGRTEHTAIGTVVNLAARVCAIAAGQQILVTNRVHAAVEERVAANPLGDVDFKGLSRPVPVYEIMSLRRMPAQPTGTTERALRSSRAAAECLSTSRRRRRKT